MSSRRTSKRGRATTPQRPVSMMTARPAVKPVAAPLAIVPAASSTALPVMSRMQAAPRSLARPSATAQTARRRTT